MLISNKIKDVRAAGQAWIEATLAKEEINLKDYDRPLKVIKEKGKSPFQSQVARYGFMNAITRFIAP